MDKMKMENISAEEYVKTVSLNWKERSPIFNSNCVGCDAIAMCGNGCAYDALVHSGNHMGIDQRSCKYIRHFYNLFIEDLYAIIRPNMYGLNDFYIPTKNDRLKLLGKVKEIQNSLSYSIGHQTKRNGR
jgi:sulfatase maturation enzyme AslB (radical SAM superfamily)